MMLAKKIAVAFGIAIIFPMMIHYGVSIFYPQPAYSDYEGTYAQSNASPAEKKAAEQKQQVLKEKQKRFSTHLFYVSVPLGIIAIIVGAFIKANAVGTGLIFGGIFALTEGYWVYWSELNDPLRFASLVLALIVLIVIGYKKMSDKHG